MATLGLGLFVVGILIMTGAGLWLLVKAFQTSVLWGLGYIFVPFVSIIFVILHWQDTKKPFLYLLAGLAVFTVGAVFGGAGSELTPT
jgi:hypothetical protein